MATDSGLKYATGMPMEKPKPPISYDSMIAIAEGDPSNPLFRQVNIIEETTGQLKPSSIALLLEIKGRPMAATRSDGRIYAIRPHESKKGLVEVYWLNGRYKLIIFEFLVEDSIWRIAHRLVWAPFRR